MNKICLVLILISGIQCTNKNPRTGEAFSKELLNKVQSNLVVKIDTVNENPLFEISFQESSVFGETDDVLFQYVGQFSVSNSNRVFISDKNDIKVFDREQNFIKTLGRKGRGPGEFNNFGALSLATSLNRLFVYDEVLHRINVFNLNNLEYQHAIALANSSSKDDIPELKTSRFKDFLVLNDSLLLVSFKDYGNPTSDTSDSTRYYLMDAYGELQPHKIISYDGNDFYDGNGVPSPIAPRAPLNYPSTRSAIVDSDNKGTTIYYAWTNEFKIKIYDLEGQHIRTLFYPFINSELDKKEIIDEYKYNPVFYNKARQDDFPKNWPALNYFFVDDENRIWISTITDDKENYDWFVLKNNGELLGKFKWKGERSKRHYQEREIKLVQNGYLYTLEQDVDTGQKKIVKYEIVLKKN